MAEIEGSAAPKKEPEFKSRVSPANVTVPSAGPKRNPYGITYSGQQYVPGFGKTFSAWWSAFGDDPASLTSVMEAAETEPFFGERAKYSAKSGVYLGQEVDKRTPITQEDYEASESFREEIQYYDGMTAEAAKVLANRRDRAHRREWIFDRSPTWQKAASFPLALPRAMMDPTNIMASLIPLPGTGAARSIPIIAKAMEVGTPAVRAVGKGFAQGAVGNVYMEPLAAYNAAKLQEDYGFYDALLNVTVGGLVGGSLGGAAHALSVRGMIKQQRQVQEVMQRSEENARMVADHLENIQLAVGQLEGGKRVEVEASMAAREVDPFDPRVMFSGEAPSRRKYSAEEFTGMVAREFDYNTEMRAFKEWGARQEGSRYVDLPRFDDSDLLFVEAAIGEVQAGQPGYRTFREVDGQGSTMEISGEASTYPDWMKGHNEEAIRLEKERASQRKRGEEVKGDAPVVLTRELVERAGRKLMNGEPLGKREYEVAGMLVDRAAELKRTQLEEIKDLANPIGVREEAAEMAQATAALKRVNQRVEQEEWLQATADRYHSPEGSSTADVDAARAIDEELGEWDPAPMRDEELVAADQEMDALKNQGYISEAEFHEYREFVDELSTAERARRTYQAAGYCMAREAF